MSVKEIAFRSEDLGMKAWSVASLTLALNEAIYHGGYGVQEYEGALFALVQMTGEVAQGVRTMTDSLFNTLHAESGSLIQEGEKKCG